MNKLFEEYGTLALCYVCSIVGFDILFKILVNSDSIHNLINHFLYGTL